jgi:hypothetical protein
MLYYCGLFEGRLEVNGLELFVGGENMHCIFVFICNKMLLWYVNFVLHFQDKYAIHFANNIKNAKPVSGADIVQKAHNIDGDVRIKYKDQWDFENIAQQFGIFQEWKVFLLFLFSILKRQCIMLSNVESARTSFRSSHLPSHDQNLEQKARLNVCLYWKAARM